MLAAAINDKGLKLGINGLGRIGKLSVWHHVSRKYFKEIVVNIGREAGTSLADVAHYLERDSTYGRLSAYLRGIQGPPVIEAVDDSKGTMLVDGVQLKFLRTHRNPYDIDWQAHDVRLVVDTTGQFLDPTQPGDRKGGALRGHLECGAEKVIASAPFKIKEQGQSMPEDAVTTVMGINDSAYDPRRHRLISNASCTTTCLAHMMKPLLNVLGPNRILSASMATVHAATGSQAVLDRLPKSGKTDLRKNRSIMNNIILTTTGAARALRLVIPEMEQIGFIAESVRVPTVSGSLIILVLNIQEDISREHVRREFLNDIYRQAAATDPNQYLLYSDKQNVSADIVGAPRAAAMIEGHETHTRTAEISIDLNLVPGFDNSARDSKTDSVFRVPITQAVVYGWYDNEMASYVNMLGDRIVSIAQSF